MTERKETSEQIAARVRESLPAYLRRTPEELEADRKAQALRVASFTRAKQTDEERLMSRGMQLEEIARSNLKTLVEDKSYASDVPLWLTRLADSLEMQGKYTEAAKVHPLQEEKERLQKIEEAIGLDDETVCDCKPTRAQLNDVQIEAHPQYEVKKVYSRAHGKLVSLVGCSRCGRLNAMPNPPEQLAKILHAHAASHVAKRTVMNDVELLKVRQ